MALLGGYASPEWLHLGLFARQGSFAGGVSLGTQLLAHDLTVAARWFVPAPLRGGFLEAGASVVRLAALSDQTPTDLFGLAFLGLGWQWRGEHWLFELAMGPPPLQLGNRAFTPLAVLDVTGAPRFRLDLGYAF